jgi:hypothetical protein
LEICFFIDDGKFKFLYNQAYQEFPISRFVWLIQSDIEKISADRLYRFQTKKFNEFRPTPLGNELVLSRDYISIGEIILANTPQCAQTMIGVVLKFRKNPPPDEKNPNKKPSEIEKKFVYSTFKFKENKYVEFLLYPCFFLSEDGLVLNEGWNSYLKSDSYVYTVNEICVNFANLSVTDEFFEKISSFQ